MHISQRPLRVLVVEDDATDFFIICEYIKGIKNQTFTVDQCARYNDALSIINKKEYDIYFVDYRLGSKTGLDLLRYAIENNCEEPLILLTGKGNPTIDQEAMEIGAADYLVKSEINSENLERAIRYALSRSTNLKALRLSEKKYRDVFERSLDAIFITDDKLNLKDVNAAGAKLFQCDISTLLKLNLFDFITKDDLRNKIRNELTHEGEIIDLEVNIIDKENENKDSILSITKYIDDSKTISYYGILHNITDWKKAEKASRQADKLAATWRLARTLAHEVRNPLTTIQMSVDQIEDLGKKEGEEIFIDIIKRNTQRINDLITELLESAHPGEIQLELVDLKKIIQDTVQLAMDRIQLNGLQIILQSPPEPCHISANSEKMTLAFLNILVNSIEAVEPNRGIIHINVSREEKFFIIKLSDNGCGIPNENISSLFEPYFTSKKNGMGLGLATTLNIIKAHAGEIEVVSETEKGTHFIIKLPLLSISEDYQSATNLAHEQKIK